MGATHNLKDYGSPSEKGPFDRCLLSAFSRFLDPRSHKTYI